MRNQTNNRRVRSGLGTLAAMAVLLPVLSGCDSFFEVRTPNIIDASTVDPVADGTIFSRSAFQTFAAAYGDQILYTAWFTNEAWVGDTFPTRNEFGRRLVDDRNGTFSGIWFGLQRGISQAEQVIESLGTAEGTDLNVARAAMTSGFGLVLQAEAYCEGTMRQAGNEPGGLMTPAQLLEAAVQRFDMAIARGGAASGAEATSIVGASRVGKGRALLQLGQGGAAASAVAGVSPDFEFVVPYVDDAGNRGRLGNGVYFYSAGGSRESLVVPPHYRAMGQDFTGDPTDPPGDPRITFFDSGRDGQDSTLRLWSQLKYPSWASGIRLASGLEARYIVVEAGQNPGEMLTFINERRAVGGQDPISTTNLTELTAALMDQRSRDFWLEAKRMGDFRRHGNLVPNILQPGPYYKDGIGDVSDQTCWPLPNSEREANDNIP
jgi:starch-binding outer membrane protein, SusD/RagB family